MLSPSQERLKRTSFLSMDDLGEAMLSKMPLFLMKANKFGWRLGILYLRRARMISMVSPKQLINDMGLKDSEYECFGIRQMIACFYAVGSLPEVRDAFKR